MSDNQGAYILYIALCMVLVGSALASRRLPVNMAVRLALAWIAIFAVFILIMSFFVTP